jgi:endonuclease-3
VASVAFNKPALAVDTHVFRVAARIGLSTGSKSPLETEKQLIEFIPQELIAKAHHWLILHGRYVCTARKPACTKCGLTGICYYFQYQKPA